MSLLREDTPQEVKGDAKDGQYDHPVGEQQPEALKPTKLHQPRGTGIIVHSPLEKNDNQASIHIILCAMLR